MNFPILVIATLPFSQFISWREALIAAIVIKKEVVFASLTTNCEVVSNRILFVCKSHFNLYQHKQLFDLRY